MSIDRSVRSAVSQKARKNVSVLEIEVAYQRSLEERKKNTASQQQGNISEDYKVARCLGSPIF